MIENKNRAFLLHHVRCRLHGLVAELKVEDLCARSDRLLELFALVDLARVAVDQEAFGALKE